MKCVQSPGVPYHPCPVHSSVFAQYFMGLANREPFVATRYALHKINNNNRASLTPKHILNNPNNCNDTRQQL